jgi:imidazolonepropionase-like amidohydrolase
VIRHIGCCFMLVLLGLSGLVSASDLVLRGGKLYPSPDATAIADATVVIRDGRIAAAGPRATTPLPAGARIIDTTNNVIVAGFWNSHVHIITPPLLRAAQSDPRVLNSEMDAMFNRWGFTTVFDIASVLDNTLALRRRIDRGEVRGPHILTVGEPLWTEVPIYVLDYLATNGIRMPPVRTPEEAAARVRTLAEGGVDGIKLFTGSVQPGRVATMPLEMVRAAVKEAHERKLPVFAHPQNAAGLEVAITGGVDVLAHSTADSPPWTQAFVQRLTQARMALIPTLTLFEVEGKKEGIPDAQRAAWIEQKVADLREFSRGGGEVLFGTDIGYIDHYDTTMEFALMARAGMGFPEILASLTTAPAKRFGYGDRRGRVAVGMKGDLVVLSGDPAMDAGAFSKVRMTVKSGVVIYESR